MSLQSFHLDFRQVVFQDVIRIFGESVFQYASISVLCCLMFCISLFFQRNLAGVLFAFAQLNCSEITLRRLCHRSGLLGFDRVLSYALNEWANDIKKRQIPGKHKYL
jgi:hypothetical protein